MTPNAALIRIYTVEFLLVAACVALTVTSSNLVTTVAVAAFIAATVMFFFGLHLATKIDGGAKSGLTLRESMDVTGVIALLLPLLVSASGLISWESGLKIAVVPGLPLMFLLFVPLTKIARQDGPASLSGQSQAVA